MSLNEYWSAEQQAWIMPALWELESDGTVSGAKDWSVLRPDVESKLGQYGAGSFAESLVKPLDEAVSAGKDIRALVRELSAEYQAASAQPLQSAQVEYQEGKPEQSGTAKVDEAAFAAELPPAEDLADQIVKDLGSDIAALIAADPELAKIPAETLTAWIQEDIQAAFDELAAAGWDVS